MKELRFLISLLLIVSVAFFCTTAKAEPPKSDSERTTEAAANKFRSAKTEYDGLMSTVKVNPDGSEVRPPNYDQVVGRYKKAHVDYVTATNAWYLSVKNSYDAVKKSTKLEKGPDGKMVGAPPQLRDLEEKYNKAYRAYILACQEKIDDAPPANVKK